MKLLIKALLLLLPITATAAETTQSLFEVSSSGVVTLDDKQFANIDLYFQSDEFKVQGKRCGIEAKEKARPKNLSINRLLAKSTADCTTSLTQIQNEYWPPTTYTIPVWFHVIYKTDGTGNITEQRILDQMTVLNEDFGAKSGTLGANGYNVQIQFELAGIDRTENDTWYADSGDYKTPLNKDPNLFLNVYTNSASGNLGYAYFPQNGTAGTTIDGVVMLDASIGGRNNGYSIYDQGRTLVHEVGHYLGLDHTFNGSSCNNTYTEGDLIVDTNAQSIALYDCSVVTSCGSSDPVDNYMGYADDTCMNKFTREQANRAVCALVNYRPNAYRVNPSTYTVTPSAGTGGTITPDTDQIINSSATASFTITPSIGYDIDLVDGCGGTLSSNIYTTSAIISDCTVVASFVENNTTYTVGTLPSPGGKVEAPTEVTGIRHRATTTFTLTPDTDYNINYASGCSGLLNNNIYTTGPITADCTVSIDFAKPNYSKGAWKYILYQQP